MKIKIQIKSIYGSVLFELEKENNSIGKTLVEAIKSSADLRYADLGYANLGSANLSYANLRSANLSSANLSSANLSSANLDKKYIQVTCIGSRKEMTTYCFQDNKIWCGCFTGTLEEFELKVNKTHKDNPVFLKEYLGFIQYVKSLKD